MKRLGAMLWARIWRKNCIGDFASESKTFDPVCGCHLQFVSTYIGGFMITHSVLTRLLGGLVVIAGLLTLSAPATANLVTNGSFETGSFSGWTQTGNTTFNGVQCPGAGFVPQGNCDAFFGPVGSVGGISQSFGTQIGALLHVHFNFQSDGGNPGSFLAQWVSGSTTTLLNLSNPPAGAFQAFDFNVLANAATSSIQFSFRDDPGFMFLDNVQVVPEPGSLALLGLALAGLAASRRRKTRK